MMRVARRMLALTCMLLVIGACDDDEVDVPNPVDPSTATRVSVDRFSDAAATLFRRSGMPSLPAANAPIDMDQPPFITQGLGPDGAPVRYYNFDVMATMPAPIFVLFRPGESQPVAGQLNIVDVVPGDAGYSDFWQVVRVTVPADYVANTITSRDELVEAGYAMETTSSLVNCPIVPEGSMADEGGGADGLTQGWYRGQAVFYFNFGEAPLMTTGSGQVPTAPIYVTFNTNPDEPGGGPASGFMTQGMSVQTHNVVAVVPGQQGYSPLWSVIPIDNAAFADVHDLESARAVDDFGTAALVNCPIVFVGDAPADPDAAADAVIDRFGPNAALFQRTDGNGLPGAGEPIDMDQAPFITQGLGPSGSVVRYYNFDVQAATPAPIYVLIHEGTGEPVAGQLNIVDVVPGEMGYNDFWRVVRVLVPDGYIANSATSLGELQDAGYAMEMTDVLVNCPIVPDGSTAMLGGGADGLSPGWYRGDLVHYFNFGEAPLMTTDDDEVPTAPIYVSFNVNPDMPDGGPASGFMTEPGTSQTHNVVSVLPGQNGYSPLWEVFPYDNAAFATVMDLASAQAAMSFGAAALVNCPVVSME